MARSLKRLIGMICLVVIAACSNDKDAEQADQVAKPPLTAATLGEQQISTTAEYLQSEPYVAASEKNGQQQAQICRACHSFEENGSHMIGPALHGMFGRQAGALEGFDYSSVLLEAEFVWTPRALDAWLSQPGAFLPGNRMAFAGVFRESDRADLIAYLLRATSKQEEQ